MKNRGSSGYAGRSYCYLETVRYAHLRTLVSKKYIRKFTFREIFLRDFLQFGRYLPDICHNSLVL